MAQLWESKNGAFDATINGFASVSAASALIRYSDSTGNVAAGEQLSIGNLSYTFGTEITPATVVLTVTDFAALVDGFVSLGGDLAFTGRVMTLSQSAAARLRR